MKTSEVIIQNGVKGHRYALHASVEKSDSQHAPGMTLKLSTTYEDTRNPNEHRVAYQQYFASQAEYDRFVEFLSRFHSKAAYSAGPNLDPEFKVSSVLSPLQLRK